MADNDLHGNAPDKASAALLIVDVINDLEFPGAEHLFKSACSMAESLAEFKKRASSAGIPSIYVNDNFGRWRSSRDSLISHSLESNVRERKIVKVLRPTSDDYFILSPNILASIRRPFRSCLSILASGA